MGPHWASGASPAPGHQFDCTYTNSNWSNNGCTVSIWTVSTGQNCYYENFVDPSVTGSLLYTNTACVVQFNGTATGVLAPGGTHCSYSLNLKASWASGVRSEVFSGSGFPLSASMEGGPGGIYRMQAYTTPSTPTPTVSGQHQLTVFDDFSVKMPTMGCPRSTQTGFKGNVRDIAPDTAPGDYSVGFFADNVVL